MAREFSFDTFPYESLHYSILERLQQVESLDEKDETNAQSSADFSLFADVNLDAMKSLYYECGRCKLVCSLYGPVPAQRNSILPPNSGSNLSYAIRYAPYAYKRDHLSHKDSQTDVVLSKQLANAIDASLMRDEKNDHLQWNVDIRVLWHDAEKMSFLDGSQLGFGCSVLSAAINCTSVVLILAGIPTKGLVSSSSLLHVEYTDKVNESHQIIDNPSGNIIKEFMAKKHSRESESSIANLSYCHAAFVTYGRVDSRAVSAFTVIGKADHKNFLKHLLGTSWKIYQLQRAFIEDFCMKNPSSNSIQWV